MCNHRYGNSNTRTGDSRHSLRVTLSVSLSHLSFISLSTTFAKNLRPPSLRRFGHRGVRPCACHHPPAVTLSQTVPIFPSRRLAAAATFHRDGNFYLVRALLRAVSHRVILAGRVCEQREYTKRGVFAKKCSPAHAENGPKLEKICSGDLSGSGLRKYALRQNHTISV